MIPSEAWLPALPEDWELVRVRHVANVGTGSKDTVNATEEGEYPFFVRSPDVERIDTYSYDTEAILTPGDGDVGRVFHHVTGRFDVHQRVYVFTRFQGVMPRFFYYWMLSQFHHRTDQGTAMSTVASLRRPMIVDFPILRPPLDRQHAIAGFLDRETAQIDAMIEAQRELVTGLEERQCAVRALAVGPHLESGDRLKVHLVESDERVSAAASEHVLLSVSIDWGVRPRDASAQQEASDDLSNYKLVREGDIVVNRMRAFQGALGRAPQAGMVSPDYSVFRPRDTVDSSWLAALMKSPPFVGEMASRIRGIGSIDAGQVRTPRINSADLLGIRVTIPTLEKQRRLSEAWLEGDGRMASLINAANESMTLMQERRAALISAAVTGRVDPRTGKEYPTSEETP